MTFTLDFELLAINFYGKFLLVRLPKLGLDSWLTYMVDILDPDYKDGDGTRVGESEIPSWSMAFYIIEL